MKVFIEDNFPILAQLLKWIKTNTINKIRIEKQKKQLKQEGKEVLKNIKDIFDELNIEWFLVYGTLLGAHREKDFISHDVDIDIGVFFEDYTEEIEKSFLKRGFIKKHMFVVDDGKFAIEETYVYNGLGIDIFYFKKEKDKLIGYGFINESGLSWSKTIEKHGGLLVRELTFPYEGLEEYNFLGIDCKIPKNPEKHLSSHYGKDFMNKDAKWEPSMVTNVKYLKDKIGVIVKDEK